MKNISFCNGKFFIVGVVFDSIMMNLTRRVAIARDFQRAERVDCLHCFE